MESQLRAVPLCGAFALFTKAVPVNSKLVKARLLTTFPASLFVLGGFDCLAAAPFDTWEWRHPLPHGNSIRALAEGPVGGTPTLVTVGVGGAIATQRGTSPWTLRSSGVGSTLNGAEFADGRFIVVGDSGTILSSTDGTTWTPRTSGTTARLTDVTYGNNLFLALGDSGAGTGTNLVSADGLIWTPGSFGAHGTNSLSEVAFGNGVFVAVGGIRPFGPFPNEPVILTSINGLAWSRAAISSVTPQVDQRLRSVAFQNGQFVAVGQSSNNFTALVLTSPDGATWCPQPLAVGPVYGVTAGNGTFLVVGLSGGGSVTRISSNGTTWTGTDSPRYIGSDPHIAYGGGRFFLFGSGGIMLESTTGTGFASATQTYHGELWDVFWNNGRYVAVGDADPEGFSTSLLTSADGVSWTPEPGVSSTLPLRSVAFGIGKYVAVGLANSSLTSANGTAWEREPAGQPTGAELWGLTFGGGLFVGVGENGAIVTSTDGLIWSSRVSGIAADTLFDVAFGNNTFVAVGGSQFGFGPGVTVTSADGITWTPVTWTAGNPAPTAVLRGVSYLNGQFVAVGFNGQVRTSADGVNWTPRVAQTSAALKKVTWANDAYVVVGHGGLILTSPNLTNWLVAPSGTFNDLNAVATDGRSVVAAGLWGTILQAGNSPVPGPVIGGLVINVQGGVDVRVQTQSGRVYRLQASEDLFSWQTVASVNGDGSVQTLTDAAAVNFTHRFYQLLVE